MTKLIFKTVGEGGAHAHRLLPNLFKTALDGKHKHLFLINDRILMTDLSGEHDHNFNPKSNEVGPENQRHGHVVSVRTTDGSVDFETSKGASHPHELQVEMTTLSGVHLHIIEVGENSFPSLVPGDLIEEVMEAAKSVKQFQNLKLKRSGPMECDFDLMKKLNQSQFKDILKIAVEKSLIKRMTSIGEGLRIESLILSKERFEDVGIATRFVLDQGLDVKASRVQDEVFTFQIKERSSFEESTLQRIRITEGVDAIIGFMSAQEEGEVEGSVTASEENNDLEKGVLTNWASNKTITGSLQELLKEVSGKFGINRKFVTIECPRRGLVKHIEDNFEIDHAVYEDIADERYKSIIDMKASNGEVDVVLTKFGRGDILAFFFDDEKEIIKILAEKQKDYTPGTYMIKSTMMGYVLLPVYIDKTAKPIFDEDIVASLEHDTETFFEKRDFFLNNPIEPITHKRGIFMIGPPGNGKTTFIKHYLNKATKKNDRFGILIDCSDHFDSDMGKFLTDTLGDAEKIIVLENIDSIAEHEYQRASLLNFMDGVGGLDKTLFIATSNHPGKLDEAILNRPSRFDKKYLIDLPSLKMRKKFLKRYFPDLDSKELREYAKATKGFSGAYFKELFILKNIQEITIKSAIESLQEQMSMIFKSKKDFLTSIKVMLFEGYDDGIKGTKLKSLKAKFKNTMSSYDVDKTGYTKKTKKKKKGSKKIKKSKEDNSFKASFEILSKNEDQRLVTGPVLIPENIDLQDDIISAGEIQLAGHGYMIKLAYRDDPDFLKELGFFEVEIAGETGFQHTDFSRKAAVVETFMAPVDYVENGRNIVKGTWMMTMKIFDDEVWAMVKTDQITGFSIGGRSKSKPEKGV